jgi:hypothetical protein
MPRLRTRLFCIGTSVLSPEVFRTSQSQTGVRQIMRTLKVIFLLNVLISQIRFAQAQWTNDKSLNTPVCTAMGDQTGVRMATDENGGAIIAWNDSRSGISQIYAQRLDKHGVAQWMHDGVPIYGSPFAQGLVGVFSDEAGGILVGWTEDRGAGSTIYLQHISETGLPLWQLGGVAVVQSSDVAMTRGKRGDIFFAWPSAGDVYAQRVDSLGVVRWLPGGVVVCSDSTEQSNPVIAGDEEGGAFVAWLDHRFPNSAIFSQRIDANGLMQWNVNGNLVDSTAPTPSFRMNNLPLRDALGFALMPFVAPMRFDSWSILAPSGLVSKGNGGSIVGFTKYYNSGMNSWYYAINAAGIASNGQVCFGPSVVQTQDFGAAGPMTSDGSGGALITYWMSVRRMPWIHGGAARISEVGSLLWTFMTQPYENAVPAATPDLTGGFFISYDSYYFRPDVDILGARIPSQDIGDSRLPVSSASGNQENPVTIPNGLNGAIVAWGDDRNGNKDVFAQNVPGKPVPKNNITIQNSCGANQTLTFGQSSLATDGIDTLLGEGALPDPPVGAFDARFQLSNSVCSWKDFRPDRNSTSWWRIKFQSGPCGYPLNLAWDSVTVTGGRYYLQDEVTGRLVDIDMTAHSNFVLNDTRVTSLRIYYSRDTTSVFAFLVPRPDVLHFDSVRIGTMKADTLVVRNIGRDTMVVHSISLHGGPGFVLLDSIPFILPPGDSAGIHALFQPVSMGESTGHVVFSHNGSYSPDSAIIIGNGVASFFEPSTRLVPFFDVFLGASRVDSLLVKNSGNIPLHITSISSNSPSDFSVVEAGGATIAGGDSNYIHITYHPSTESEHSGMLSFYHDGIASPDTIRVNGRGVASHFSVIPATMVLGCEAVMSSKQDSFLVRNVGTGALIITSITLSDSIEFDLQGSTPFVIAPGESMWIRIVFTPESEGVHSTAITISHNGSSSPDTLHCNGVGVKMLACLTFADGSGLLDSLEFGLAGLASDGLDPLLGEYELPPIPPIGSPDFRWQVAGLQGSKVDLRDTVGVGRGLVMWRILLQPGPAGFPIRLRWRRSELCDGTFRLLDPAGQMTPVNMEYMDSLTIENPEISSLQILLDRTTNQKIFVHDAGGAIDSLEWGTRVRATDGIDASLGEYELPPLPPTGILDVRWKIPGMQGSDIDFRDTLGGGRTRTIFTGAIQPGEGGYPITLRWVRSTLPPGTLGLRDPNGGYDFNVDLKQQDSLVITNPEIALFQIIYDIRPSQVLYVRDHGNQEDSLIFGLSAGASDGIDFGLGESELPPIPPSGVFDLRWELAGTQGTMRDFRDTLGGGRVQAKYVGSMQPGAGGYPMTLRWKRETLLPGSFSLRDGEAGTRFIADMKRQDSLVVDQSDIGTFVITYDIRPTRHYYTLSGWNLISIPLACDDSRRAWLFPGLNSNAFAFVSSGGYVVRDSLQKGVGYWLKFPTVQDVGLTGTRRIRDTINVSSGWNIIGSISDTVYVTSVLQNPPTIIASPFFGYGGGYSSVTTLLPLKGYWVKTIAPGTLILSAGSGAAKAEARITDFAGEAARLIIQDAGGANQTLWFSSDVLRYSDPSWCEMPPPPPAGTFDARFASGRILETGGKDEVRSVPITVISARYPLTITWELHGQSVAATLVIGNRELPMTSSGIATVLSPQEQLMMKLGGRRELPMEYALRQNYPNPFNPSTTIKYDLPKDSRVSLKIYDMLGREVATLVNGDQKAGFKSAEWNATGFASGVYFYRIQASDYVATKKLVLMK